MSRSVFVSLAVAVGPFVVSAPFMVVERWAGFAVLGMAALALFLLRSRLGLAGRVDAVRVGVVLAVLLLVPARFFAEFAESGMDDGPFTGRPFVGDLSKLQASERVEFRSGELVVYSRANGAAPVLAYRVDGHAMWSQEMFVSLEERVTGRPGANELDSMTRLEVSPGILRDRLDFIAEWSQGAERGYAFIWKWGGIQRFYLSW